jgi:hypothetical protein
VKHKFVFNGIACHDREAAFLEDTAGGDVVGRDAGM